MIVTGYTAPLNARLSYKTLSRYTCEGFGTRLGSFALLYERFFHKIILVEVRDGSFEYFLCVSGHMSHH
jgi:hypothetical protein